MSELNIKVWKMAVDHARKVFEFMGFENVFVSYVQGYYAGYLKGEQDRIDQEREHDEHNPA